MELVGDLVVAAVAALTGGILAHRLGQPALVYPEFEAGLEMIRHVLHRYGVSLLEIQGLLQARRSTQYQRDEGEL